MTDPRVVLIVGGAAVLIGGIIIGLLLRGGPQGAGGSALDLMALVRGLQGRKTEILGTALLAVDQAGAMGYMTPERVAAIDKVIYALLAFTLHAAVRRTEKAGVAAVEQSQEAATLAADTHQAVRTIAKSPVTPLTVKEGL